MMKFVTIFSETDTSDSFDGVDKYDSHQIFPLNMESLMKDIRLVLS